MKDVKAKILKQTSVLFGDEIFGLQDFTICVY